MRVWVNVQILVRGIGKYGVIIYGDGKFVGGKFGVILVVYFGICQFGILI